MLNLNKSVSKSIEKLIENISPTSRHKKVIRAIEVHFQDSSRYDERGRRSSELENTRKALRHLANMPSWQMNERYDLNMRRRIGDILKHIDHGQPWSKTIVECSEARGLANKAARRRNERREYGSSDPMRLDDEFTCIPLNSAVKLRSAGKRGNNCLGDNQSGYFGELKTGQTEFYEIQSTEGESKAFLSVDKTSRAVTELQGLSNEDAELPVDTLWAICRVLKAKGDECPDFVRSGVLSLVNRARSAVNSPMSRIFDFQIWWGKGEIVIRDLKSGLWSRFTWRFAGQRFGRAEWIEAHGSDIDAIAFDFMLRCQPRLSEIADRAHP